MTYPIRFIALSFLSIGFMLSSSSCKSSRTIKNDTFSKEFLFPMGTYRHAVKIQTMHSETKETKKFSFDGVVQINETSIKIIVLSPFGTTMASFNEDRTTGVVEFENYIDAIKKYESKFKDYYSVLKLLLLAPRVPADGGSLRLVHAGDTGLPAELETLNLQPKANFLFKKYDQNQIPELIEIHNPNFSIDIRVTGYEI